MEIACILVSECALAEACEGGSATPDDRWEEALRGLEGIGAAVESEQLGEAFFIVDGLRGLHGGETAGVLATARRALAMPARIATARTRFAAMLAAGGEDGQLSALPVSVLLPRLGDGRQASDLIEALRRLGVGALGELAALSPDRVADRFGPLGLRALRLSRGEDDPPRPRRPHEELAEELTLPEGTAGSHLDRALVLLVDRLLAAPQRRGRTVLGLRLGALLSDGGNWSVEQGLGRPSASPRVLCTVLAPRLEELPAPAISLRLRALGLGPRVGEQLKLGVDDEAPRRRRLGTAVREVRVAQGADALLRVLPVDTDSRVPERRALLTPFPEL